LDAYRFVLVLAGNSRVSSLAGFVPGDGAHVGGKLAGAKLEHILLQIHADLHNVGFKIAGQNAGTT
jgi:hypothetical protein